MAEQLGTVDDDTRIAVNFFFNTYKAYKYDTHAYSLSKHMHTQFFWFSCCQETEGLVVQHSSVGINISLR